MASSVNQQAATAGEFVEKREGLWAVGGNAGWRSHWKIVWSYCKKLKMQLSLDPAIPLLGIHPKKPKIRIWQNMRTPVFIAALFTIAKLWKQPRCPSVDEWINSCCTTGYYSATEKDETPPFATAWLDLEDSMLIEIRQSEKDKYHVISLICGI